MLKISEYRKTVRRPYPPMQSFLFLKGFVNTSYYKPFFSTPYALTEVVIANDVWYCSDKQLEKIGNLTLERLKNQQGFYEIKKLFLEREKKLLNSKNGDLKDLVETFQAYQPTVLMISYAEKAVENFLKKLLLKKMSAKETREMMDLLNNPLEDNMYKKEELELVKSKNLEEHVKKYAGLYSRYGEDKIYEIEYAKKRLKKINKNEYLKKYEERKGFLKKEIERLKKILGEEWLHMIDVFQFFVYYRTHRADILNLAMYNFIPKFKEIAKKHELSYEQILFCTSEEILTNSIPDKEEIEKRKRHCFLVENGNITIVSGNDCDDVEKFFYNEKSIVKSFKGVVACSGIIKGRIKIVYSANDDDMCSEKDQILVTSMTTPDMVPLMKKSAAIITDEGGVTCHAAIISRELNIPCIIGTKIATQVLKDGDEVEVDAEKGVVKILK